MSDLDFLMASGLFFDDDDVEPLCINLNDTWGWSSADGEYVRDEDIPEVARLFRKWGFAGLVYWASEKRDGERSQFTDVNRMIDFVRQEEAFIRLEPSSSKRATMRPEDYS